jgi:hypothetical protein
LTEGCFVSSGASSGKPSCLCIAGFEMTPTTPVYSCVQCQPGKYKAFWNADLCINWTTPDCSASGKYSTTGTRTSDRICIDFPKPPVHAYSNGLGWNCNAGYEKV